LRRTAAYKDITVLMGSSCFHGQQLLTTRADEWQIPTQSGSSKHDSCAPADDVIAIIN